MMVDHIRVILLLRVLADEQLRQAEHRCQGELRLRRCIVRPVAQVSGKENLKLFEKRLFSLCGDF